MLHINTKSKILTTAIIIGASAVITSAVAGEEQTGRMLELTRKLEQTWDQAAEFRKDQKEERAEAAELRQNARNLKENADDSLEEAEAGAKMLRSQAKANYQDRKLVEFSIRTGLRSIGIMKDMRKATDKTDIEAERLEQVRTRQKNFMRRIVPALEQMLKNAEGNLNEQKVKKLRQRLINKYKAAKLNNKDNGVQGQLKGQIRKLEDFCSDMDTVKKLLEDERKQIAVSNSMLNIRAVSKYVNRLEFGGIPFEKWSGKIIDGIQKRRENREMFMDETDSATHADTGTLNAENQDTWDEMTEKYGGDTNL